MHSAALVTRFFRVDVPRRHDDKRIGEKYLELRRNTEMSILVPQIESQVQFLPGFLNSEIPYFR